MPTRAVSSVMQALLLCCSAKPDGPAGSRAAVFFFCMQKQKQAKRGKSFVVVQPYEIFFFGRPDTHLFFCAGCQATPQGGE